MAMNRQTLFSMALGLESPWEIWEMTFATTEPRHHAFLRIGFPPGSRFVEDAGTPDRVHIVKSRYEAMDNSWRKGAPR